jgi:hypothetical protein
MTAPPNRFRRSRGAWKTWCLCKGGGAADNSLFGRSCFNGRVSLPPAFSTASTAARRRARSQRCQLGLEFALGQHADAVQLAAVTPAATRASSVTAALASSLPASTNFWIRPRLTTANASGSACGEATLRQAAVQRHLAAFVAAMRDARTRGLTLDTTASGLALARAGTTRNALFLAVRRRDCRGVHAVSCRFS